MKKIICLMLALVMVLSFVACGAPASEAPVSEAPVSETPEAPKLEGTLEYWTLWNETDKQGEVIKEATDAFIAANPGVTVNINWQGRDIRKTIKAALDAGSVDMWDNAVSYMCKDYADYAIDVEPLMAAAGYQAQEALVSNVKSFSGGVVNAVPYQPTIMPIWYNADHFEQAGITEMPKTTEEFLAVCAKLKEAGFAPMSVDGGYDLLPFTTYVGRKVGLEKAAAMVNDKTGESFKDPAFVEAAEFFATMAKEGYFSDRTGSLVYPDGQNEFAMGEVSMYMVPSYFLGEVAELAGEDFPWGAMEIPNPADAVMPTTATNLGAQAFMITKNCANPELAFAYIQFLTTGEWDEKMAEQSINLPTMADAEAPAALAVAMPVLSTWTEQLPWAASMTSNADFTPAFKELLQQLYGGKLDAAAFVAECQKAVKG